MSSTPALVAWQQKYATDITQGASDLKAARQKLDAASVHVSKAGALRSRGEYDLALNAGLLDRIRTSRNAAQYEAPGTVSADLAASAVQLAERAFAELKAAPASSAQLGGRFTSERKKSRAACGSIVLP